MNWYLIIFYVINEKLALETFHSMNLSKPDELKNKAVSVFQTFQFIWWVETLDLKWKPYERQTKQLQLRLSSPLLPSEKHTTLYMWICCPLMDTGGTRGDKLTHLRLFTFLSLIYILIPYLVISVTQILPDDLVYFGSLDNIVLTGFTVDINCFCKVVSSGSTCSVEWLLVHLFVGKRDLHLPHAVLKGLCWIGKWRPFKY